MVPALMERFRSSGSAAIVDAPRLMTRLIPASMYCWAEDWPSVVYGGGAKAGGLLPGAPPGVAGGAMTADSVSASAWTMICGPESTAKKNGQKLTRSWRE